MPKKILSSPVQSTLNTKQGMDKLMAWVSKTNLVSVKKFSHEDLSAIMKSTQFSRAVREER